MCDALLFVYDFSVFLCSLSTVDLFFVLKGGGKGRGKRKNHFRSLGCPLLLKPVRVIRIKYFLTILPFNHKLRSQEYFFLGKFSLTVP